MNPSGFLPAVEPDEKRPPESHEDSKSESQSVDVLVVILVGKKRDVEAEDTAKRCGPHEELAEIASEEKKEGDLFTQVVAASLYLLI